MCSSDLDGAPVFARTLTDYQSLPSATSLYRQLLALQPDTSVTIISVGFSTNLAALLDSPADSYSDLTGRELVARKVKLLSVMAGCFDRPDFYDYNVV